MTRIAAPALLLLATLCAVPAADAAPAPTCGGEVATIVRGDGDNRVRGTAADDVVVLGAGDDHFEGSYGGGHDIVCAGPGNDVVSTTDNQVTAYLGGGNDWAQVWADGWVHGGSGKDRILTNNGATAIGGAGADEISSGASEPTYLYGGRGPDILRVGLSRPEVHGGPGEDIVTTWFDDEPVTIDLAAGTISNETFGTFPIDGIEDAQGTAYDDVLLGDGGPNALDGGAGDDRADGRGGTDRCYSIETAVSC